MKKYIILLGLTFGTTGFLITSLQSCTTIATTVGLPILKNTLIGGVSKGLGVFKDKNSFLGNQIISAALPQELKDINSTLEKIGLGSLVTKEKQYIAETAASIVPVVEPILINTIQNMTSEEAQKIALGGKGAATSFLKEKTSAPLIAAIAPKIDEKLNEYGIVKTINSALKGNSLLNSFLGNNNQSTSGSISNLVTKQMVNGLFGIIENYEKTSTENPMNLIK